MRRIAALVLALASCGTLGENAPADASQDTPADVVDPLGTWGTAVRIVELTTTSIDQDATLTPDLLEMVFASNRPGTSGGSDLWVSTRLTVSDLWGAPTLIPNVNSIAEETQPYLQPDGLRMYFSSTQTGGVGLGDIYVTVRASRTSPWSTPSLVPELSSSSEDQMGGLTPDQLTVAVSSDRGGPSTMRDIYLATRTTATGTFTVPAVASATVTNLIESAPVFAGDALYFVSNNDLYVAQHTGTTISAPTPISELNTATTDSDPWVSEDQRTIFFSRDDATGTAQDIWMATR